MCRALCAAVRACDNSGPGKDGKLPSSFSLSLKLPAFYVFMPLPMKKKILSAVQVVFGVSIISFLFYRMHQQGQLSKLLEALKNAASNWPMMLASVLCFAVCLVMCTRRWQILLEAQDIRLPFPRVTMLYFVGHFFSCFLPGATSGDIFKAIYVSRETKHLRTEAVATVFIDRIIGLIALVALTVIIMLSRLQFFLSFNQTRMALVFNTGLLVTMSFGLLVVFRQNIFEKWPLFRKLEEKTFVGGIIRRLYTAFHACIKSRSVLTRTLGISLANHIVFILSAFLIGKALGIEMRFIDYLTVFPVINAVAAIPVTPGGIGTRDAVTVFLLGVFDVLPPVAMTLSLLIYLSTLFWGLVGGIVYACYVFTNPRKPDVSEPKD